MSGQPYTPDEFNVRMEWVTNGIGSEDDLNAEFDRFIAKVKAEAWDEGHDAATDEAPDGVWPDAWIDAHNPYRQEAGQ